VRNEWESPRIGSMIRSRPCSDSGSGQIHKYRCLQFACGDYREVDRTVHTSTNCRDWTLVLCSFRLSYPHYSSLWMKYLLFIWLLYNAASVNRAVQHQMKCNNAFINNQFWRMWKEAVLAYNFFHAGCWLQEACWHWNFGHLAMVLCVLPRNYLQLKRTYCLHFLPWIFW